MHDTVVQVHGVQVAVVVEKDLDESLRRVTEGGHGLQHLPLVLEGAVLALQNAKEHRGDEHLDLGLQVRLVMFSAAVNGRERRRTMQELGAIGMTDGKICARIFAFTLGCQDVEK